MGRLTLILGGARSGKSSFAQRLAGERAGQVVYIATAQALDDEMAARIQAHRQDRPAEWSTLEIPLHVGLRLQEQPAAAELFLLDCLTLLVTNLLMAASPQDGEPDEHQAAEAVEAEISALLVAIQEGEAEWIVVSNEVGLGLVPPYPLGRVYRDELGRANQRLASAADEVYFMVAGLPLPVHQLQGYERRG